MRIAVISDIHGNLTALEAVLKDVQASRPDATVCLGDLAYKGPQPAECVARIRDMGLACVHGNTDLYLLKAAGMPPTGCYPVGMTLPLHLQWHLDRLGKDHLEYLAGLPFSHRIEADGIRLLFVHASPKDCISTLRPSTVDKIADLTWEMDADWCVMGHIHSPFAFRFAGSMLINAGAVGFSLDYEWRASWALLDTATRSVSLHRVEFSIEEAVAAARKVEFPFGADWYDRALRMGYHN
ncbi:MAG TPA: metallophosphoesterase family protein [Symbiobacteriaceae bacterium]|nr:metallophosphoesterase family protein [Symbiobacteriaceae bacterium]